MNSTSFASRLVRIAARSPGRSSTGPEVWRRLTPISRAMMCASVVLPRPGGPNSKRVVERFLALARGRNEDFELAADLFLADVFVQVLRPQRALDRLLVGRGGRGRDDALLAEIVGLDAHRLLLSFGQRLERVLDAVGHGAAGRHVLDRRQRFLVRIPQRQQRIEDIRLGVVAARRRPARRGRRPACPSVRAAGARRFSCRCRAP